MATINNAATLECIVIDLIYLPLLSVRAKNGAALLAILLYIFESTVPYLLNLITTGTYRFSTLKQQKLCLRLKSSIIILLFLHELKE